jgi:nucleotide-binding universal stress UspA family protein
VVVFGASHFATVRGLARVATVLAHHFHALPMSVRVLPQQEKSSTDSDRTDSLFLSEQDEVESMGYPLIRELLYGEPASVLVSATEYHQAHAVVLGYPLGRTSPAFQRVLDQVASNVLCPVVAVHFSGTISFNRILVPFLFPRELDELLPFIKALADVSEARVTLCHLLHSDSSRDELVLAEKELTAWKDDIFFDIEVRCRVEASESRLESIVQESAFHDLVLMTAAKSQGLQRMFFGSLANSVVSNCSRSVFIVQPPNEDVSQVHQNYNTTSS